MGYALRTAPSGPLIRAADGQVLAYNAATDEWDGITLPTPTTPVLPYDFAFTSYADLATQFPSVGGVHTMPDAGTYLIAGAIVMPADTRLVFAANVTLQALRGAGIAGDIDGDLITTATSANLYDLALVNVNASPTAVTWRAGTGDSTAYNVTSTGPGVGPTFSAGSNTLTSCTSTHDTVAYGLGGTEMVLIDCKGANAAQLLLLSTGIIDRLTLIGGAYRNGGIGLALFSGIGEALIAAGTYFEGCTTAVTGNPSVGAASLTSIAAVACTNGIDWPTAEIPANGLLIVGCLLDCTNPLVGFAPSDPRVNIKACAGVGALLTETAIV